MSNATTTDNNCIGQDRLTELTAGESVRLTYQPLDGPRGERTELTGTVANFLPARDPDREYLGVDLETEDGSIRVLRGGAVHEEAGSGWRTIGYFAEIKRADGEANEHSDDSSSDVLVSDGGVTDADCPNCYTDDDTETDCPHLLEGDECPHCGHTLSKPPAGKVRCERCRWVINGQYNEQELHGFALSVRQGKRLLDLFGEEGHGTPGTIGSKFHAFCSERGISIEGSWIA